MTVPVLDALRDRLQGALQPELLEIRDDSAAHAGHAGARSGGHYAVRIVARQFGGHRLLDRHRLVYTAVAGLLDNGVHALSIDAVSPDEIT